MELLKEKKILFIYFLYLFIGFTIYLTLHVSEFPYKYVFTDWLINYEGGFIRRGLLGQICFYISNVFNLDFKYVVLIFQILIYFIYFLLFFYLFSKIKINFFWILIIFSPIAFLYPLSELMSLGRKDVFVISTFLAFVIINQKSINSILCSFIIFFGISVFIHEITFFYLFHYLFVIYLKNKLLVKKKINILHYLAIFIFLLFLLYLNLYQSNFAELNIIINSYNYEDITVNSGAFSWLSPSFNQIFFNTLSKIDIISVIRYLFIFLINTAPFFYFINFKESNDLKFLTTKNFFIVIFFLSVPMYLLIFDWGRVIYINFNFFIIILAFCFLLNLIDLKYLEVKINNLNKKIKIFFFIIVCMSFSPKNLLDDDLGSFPLYRTITRIINGTIDTLGNF